MRTDPAPLARRVREPSCGIRSTPDHAADRSVRPARELGYTAITGTTFRDTAFNVPFYARRGCVEDAAPHPAMLRRRQVEQAFWPGPVRSPPHHATCVCEKPLPPLSSSTSNVRRSWTVDPRPRSGTAGGGAGPGWACDTPEGPPVLMEDSRAFSCGPVRRESSGLDNRRLSATVSISRTGPRILHEAPWWWRWRESNPRPLTVNQDFSGCSALWIFSAPALARTRPLTGPAG